MIHKLLVAGSIVTTAAAIFCLSFWITGVIDRELPSNADTNTPEQEYLSQLGYTDSEYQLKIGENSSEIDVYSIMHRMTHSKIEVKDEKNDFIETYNYEEFIPITHQTISTLKEYIEKTDFAMKDDTLAIIDKWEIGFFGSIQQDHDWCIAMLGEMY